MNQLQGRGPSHDRWLISYADFVTLLFAVFVVLFVAARADKGAARRISDAVVEALRGGGVKISVASRAAPEQPIAPGLMPSKGQTSTRALVELAPSLKLLTEQLKKEIAEKKVEIRMEPRGLVISLSQAVFFPSGQATLNPDTYATTDKIARVVSALPNAIRLEGHTDAVPIRNSHFASNWELSAGRSIAMLDLFTERNRIPRERLSIAGFADTEPLGSNTNAEGRARNRRVDVVILNETLELGGSPAAPAN